MPNRFFLGHLIPRRPDKNRITYQLHVLRVFGIHGLPSQFRRYQH